MESLRALITLRDAGGFAAAAARLHLTQPAVSHRLRRLEVAIGQTLVLRGHGPLSLTGAGADLAGYAERIVALHDEAVQSLQRGAYSGVVELGLTEAIVSGDLAGVLGQYRRLYPQVDVRCRVDTSKLLAQGLREGRFDLALLQAFTDRLEPGDETLWEERLVWVASADSPGGVQDEIPYVSFDRECFYRDWAETTLRETGRRLEVVLECGSLAGATSAVQAGLGISLLPESKVTPAMREVSELPRAVTVSTVIRSAADVPPEQVAGLRKLCRTITR
ncbi:LysR family transcriptional regulator [Lutibaculum baratangense]|uniref:LysR family transcriptional regulator n=1 Tax=Lutibaculum baratangense TaxID=1358440 RepID=UPI001FCB8689|nr:LysR family transcriptional regulator [Lutibaculum baratangense]